MKADAHVYSVCTCTRVSTHANHNTPYTRLTILQQTSRTRNTTCSRKQEEFIGLISVGRTENASRPAQLGTLAPTALPTMTITFTRTMPTHSPTSTRKVLAQGNQTVETSILPRTAAVAEAALSTVPIFTSGITTVRQNTIPPAFS